MELNNKLSKFFATTGSTKSSPIPTTDDLSKRDGSASAAIERTKPEFNIVTNADGTMQGHSVDIAVGKHVQAGDIMSSYEVDHVGDTSAAESLSEVSTSSGEKLEALDGEQMEAGEGTGSEVEVDKNVKILCEIQNFASKCFRKSSKLISYGIPKQLH